MYEAIFDYPKTQIVDGSGKDVTDNYFIVHIPVEQIIYGAKTTYTVEYYYDGVRDDSETIVKNAYQGDVINSYPTKLRDGYRFAYDSGLPLKLRMAPENNVIRVYYAPNSVLDSMAPLGFNTSLPRGEAIEYPPRSKGAAHSAKRGPRRKRVPRQSNLTVFNTGRENPYV